MSTSSDLTTIGKLLGSAKQIAKEYRQITGKPLGITGEVGEYEAARILGIKLAEARQTGYDAVRRTGEKTTRIQIKTRCLPANAKQGQRLGSIRLEKPWDSIVVVLLDEELEPVEIYEAERPAVEHAIKKPGSKARNERGALGLSQFKSIGKRIWSRRR